MTIHEFQCCVCANGVPRIGSDPVEISIRPADVSDTGEEQVLWAHSTCLHRAVHPTVSLLPRLPDELELLPRDLALRSASPVEVVLPYRDALDAIRIIHSKGMGVAGWEGWIRTPDGRVGHGDAPSGATLSRLGVDESARACSEQIQAAESSWRGSSLHPEAELLFCITFAE